MDRELSMRTYRQMRDRDPAYQALAKYVGDWTIEITAETLEAMDLRLQAILSDAIPPAPAAKWSEASSDPLGDMRRVAQAMRDDPYPYRPYPEPAWLWGSESDGPAKPLVNLALDVDYGQIGSNCGGGAGLSRPPSEREQWTFEWVRASL